MADTPSFDALFEIGRREVLLRNPNVATDAVDREGADANALVAVSAAVGDEVLGQLAEVEAGLWLSTAKGVRLDRLAWDRYSMPRKPAAVAYGEVEFTTTTPAAAAFTIPAALELPSTDGRKYVTVESVPYPAGSVGPVSVRFTSVLTGTAQRLASGGIIRYSGTISGAPADLEVTNALATAGGDNVESDDDFVARIRASQTANPPGTAKGIIQKALAFPGVRTANVFSHVNTFGLPSGINVLVISDAYTEALATLNEPVPAYEAQSQAMARAVYESLDDTRACGIALYVVVGAVRMIPIVLNLTLQASAPPETVTRARAAAARYLNARPPGKGWVREDALARLSGVGGLVITGKEIAYPPGDVVASPLEVLRTDMAIVTLTSGAAL